MEKVGVMDLSDVDSVRRKLYSISETFSMLYDMACNIEGVDEESEALLFQLKGSMKDLKFILDRYGEVRHFDLNI